ncbi:MAG: exodeoxyribonuclease VII small subunit [Sutterella seckii]
MTEAVQKPARPPEELSFEEALAELEALTSQMASGTVTLEESVKG